MRCTMYTLPIYTLHSIFLDLLVQYNSLWIKHWTQRNLHFVRSWWRVSFVSDFCTFAHFFNYTWIAGGPGPFEICWIFVSFANVCFFFVYFFFSHWTNSLFCFFFCFIILTKYDHFHVFVVVVELISARAHTHTHRHLWCFSLADNTIRWPLLPIWHPTDPASNTTNNKNKK